MTAAAWPHLYSEYATDEADQTNAYVWPPLFKLIESLPKGSHVLDAGCGAGFFAKELNDRGFEVCGMDLAESGIARARRLWPAVDFKLASVYDNIQDLFGRQFDAIISLEVVEHLYNPRLFLSRMREGLRPNGRLILSTPYHGYLKNSLIALKGGFDVHVSPLWDGGHIKFWSRRTLTSLLEEQGFRVNGFVGAGRLPYLWKSMILDATRI